MFLSAILAVIQILFFAIIFYIILRLLRHTPGIYAFGSLFFIIFLLSLLAYFCHLDVITRVTSFFLRWILPVAFVIIFQQDFRRWLLFLPTLSNNRRALLLWRRSIQKKRRNINGAIYELVNAVCSLSARPEWRNYLLHANNPSPVDIFLHVYTVLNRSASTLASLPPCGRVSVSKSVVIQRIAWNDCLGRITRCSASASNNPLRLISPPGPFLIVCR